MHLQKQRSCNIGLYLFQEEGWMDGRTAGWNDIKAMTQTAEAIGFDSIWLPDRLMRVREGQQQGLWEAVTMLSAMAAVTSRIEIGHAVLRSIYRNPALLVRMAETLDEISGGRFILGLGSGSGGGTDRDNDEPVFGYPETYRYSRFEEALQIILGLLKTGHVNFRGKFYQARQCVNRPRGPHTAGPPIFIAASRPKMMRLAARHADIWGAPVAAISPHEYQPLQTSLRDACAEVGRDPLTLHQMAVVNIDPLSRGESARNPYGPSLSGPPYEIAGILRDFIKAGFSHILLIPFPNSLEAVEACAPILESFDQQD